MVTTKARAANIAWSLAIVLISVSAGILVDWQAPGIGRYARDWLMRARGPLPVPEDIAIVAIDEASMVRFGRFPWSRQVIARTIDALAAAHPKVIALDVLFTDPTTQEDDDNLARSIGRAGIVVVAAQLTDSPVHGGPSRWLQPLPAIERSAAAIGHVNAQTELDGIVRQMAVRLADDNGRPYRSMAVEAVRIADGTPEEGVTDVQDALLLGARTIKLETSPAPVAIAPSASTQVLHGGRMAIDYIGPAGSFGPVTYSLSDVVSGRVPAEKFRGKFVLIGATAASLGDRVASPFVRYTDARADQHGALMPGVEVLANAIHVILGSRYYAEPSDTATFLWSATVALLTLLLLEWAQGGRELLKQLGVLVGMAAMVILVSYLAFLKLLIYPPMVPCLVAFACAGLLALLRRSLVASARLDDNIAQLALSGDLLAPAGPGIPGPYHWAEGGPVSLVARLASQGPGMESAHSERSERPPAGPRQVRQFRAALRGGRTTDRQSLRAHYLCQSQRRGDSGRPRARPGGAESDPALVRIGGRGNSRQRGGRTRAPRTRNLHPRPAHAAIHAAPGSGVRRRKGRGARPGDCRLAFRRHPAVRAAADQERRHLAGLPRNAHSADRHPGHDGTAGRLRCGAGAAPRNEPGDQR